MRISHVEAHPVRIPPPRPPSTPGAPRGCRPHGHLDRADEVLSEAVERGRSADERAIAADAGIALADLRSHRTARTGLGREDILREIDAAVSGVIDRLTLEDLKRRAEEQRRTARPMYHI